MTPYSNFSQPVLGLRYRELCCSEGFYGATTSLDQSIQLKKHKTNRLLLRFDLNKLVLRNLCKLQGEFNAKQIQKPQKLDRLGEGTLL